MKKTTVRFAAVGAVLLLGALAIALAQHDARQRPREVATPVKAAATALQPLQVDHSPAWERSSAVTASSTAIVRANDDQTMSPPPLDFQTNPSFQENSSGNNPLRDASSQDPTVTNAAYASAESENSAAMTASGGWTLTDAAASDSLANASAVQQASGEGLPGSAPGTPPPLSAAPLPVLAAPPLPSMPVSSQPPAWLESPPSQTPSNPTLSNQARLGQAPSTTASSMPAMPRASASGSLSDTQRPAMPVTNMQSMGGQITDSRSASGAPVQPWVQSPPSSNLPGNGNGNRNGQLHPGQLTAAPMATTPPPMGAPVAPPSATLGLPQPASPESSNSPGQYAAPTNPAANSFSGGRSPYAGTILGSLISNQPGNRHLDGSQNPVMLIQKRMAGECQVGKRATVVITVRNAGNSTAQDVEVIDSVPNGASFAEAIPAVTPTAEGILVWKLGEMGPGDERTINLQIIPERQGEMGSTAAVRFAAQASMRTLATLPKLELAYNAAPEVLIGSSHAIDVTVKNVGTGVARGVKLEADLPTNVRHESGDTSLDAVFGDIAPGESKRIQLNSLATEPGQASCTIRALTDDGVQQEQKVDVRVLAPALEAVITGPNRRFLDRQATFEVLIKNTGTAAATNCEFMVRLPAGLNFNTANKSGTYDPSQHAVLWSVPEFPAGHAEPVELTVLPVEVGTQLMTFQGMADLGVKTEARGGLTVEEQGELTFTIDQDADPIEISASTTYTVEVRNVGRVDRNIELSLQLPAGSQVLKVDAPVQARSDGDLLRFEPIPQMDGRSSQKFRIEVQHGKVGTQIVRAQLKSQNRPTLVIKEEATDVYNDRE
ncbi:MAG: DUF11 domain-containing protein [Pirellulaceae bacterium]|nr:DUF11 domain-containing protein [Pirellulaceae bacterium]